MAVAYRDAVLEQVGNTDSTAYTAPTVDSAQILAATAFNSGASNVSLMGNIVQSAGSVAPNNRYVNVTVPAGRSVNLSRIIGLTLNTGDFISFIAGAASSVSVKLTVKENTT